MADKLGDYNLSIRMMRALDGRFSDLIDKLRPKDRIGSVVNWNKLSTSPTADVLLAGDDTPVTVNIGKTYFPKWIYDQVRVVGSGASAYLDRAVGSNAEPNMVNPGMVNPQVWGGPAQTVQAETWFSATEAAVVAVGNACHLGRWQSNVVLESLTGTLEITISERNNQPETRSFSIPLKYNGTNGVWQKVLCQQRTTSFLGDEWDLEIMVDTSGFELRIRAVAYAASGFATSPKIAAGWIRGTAFSFVDGSAQGEITDAAAVSTYGNGNVNKLYNYGPFSSPERGLEAKIPQLLTGGGILTWDGTYINWSAGFVSICQGKGVVTPRGYIGIPVPTIGTAIPVVNAVTPYNVIVTASGIPFTAQPWMALWYEPMYADDAPNLTTGLTSQYRITQYANSAGTTEVPFYVPSHWILVATKNSTSPYSQIKWGNGITYQDYYHAVGAVGQPGYRNGWSAYAGVYGPSIGYSIDSNNIVHLEGLAQNGTVAGNSSGTIFILPAGYRPRANKIFTSVCSGYNSCRTDVWADGSVVAIGYPAAGGGNGYWSLDGISFPAVV